MKIPSIKGIINTINQPIAANNAEASVNSATIGQSSPFTLPQLEELWQQYVNKCKDENRISETLILDRPIKLNDFNIILELSNIIQEDQLNEFKGDLLLFLRTKLRNNLIKIDVVINNSEASERMYTSKDKYVFLLQKHPFIDDLRKALDLNFNE